MQASDPAGPRAAQWVGHATRLTALAGGVLLIAVVVLTVASVAGRYLFNLPIPGDYEITELACGVAVFAFFPHCHYRNGNIVVEFFTGRVPARPKAYLDAVHHVAFTAVAVIIAWRLAVGATHKLTDGETTLFLEIPVAWGYFPALIGAVMLVVVCLWRLARQARLLAR